MHFKYLNYIIFYICSILFFNGCGYKPTAYYVKNELSGNIYVKSSIDIKNSENSVLIKDIINELVISEFNSKIVNKKEEADLIISAKLLSVEHQGMETSIDGYTTLYRATVKIKISYNKIGYDNKKKVIVVSDYYDYAVDVDSIVSSQKKLDAVRLASSKALTNVFSKIAVKTFKK